jgi:hypothetical protein
LPSDWDFDVGVKKVAGGRVYQMRITLQGIQPPIWRRVAFFRLRGFMK